MTTIDGSINRRDALRGLGALALGGTLVPSLLDGSSYRRTGAATLFYPPVHRQTGHLHHPWRGEPR